MKLTMIVDGVWKVVQQNFGAHKEDLWWLHYLYQHVGHFLGSYIVSFELNQSIYRHFFFISTFKIQYVLPSSYLKQSDHYVEYVWKKLT